MTHALRAMQIVWSAPPPLAPPVQTPGYPRGQTATLVAQQWPTVTTAAQTEPVAILVCPNSWWTGQDSVRLAQTRCVRAATRVSMSVTTACLATPCSLSLRTRGSPPIPASSVLKIVTPV